MYLKPQILIACSIAILLGSAANAQSRRQMIQDLDSNGDGMIQFSELQSFRARAFDQFDTNGNGIADPSELSALEERAASSGRAGSVSFDPSAADRNGDGTITRQEFASYIPQRTLNADRDGDGALSRSELRALR